MSANVERLHQILTAAGHPVEGLAVLSGGLTQEGWDVTERGDGLRVRLDWAPGATDPQKQAARDAVLAADLSDAEVRVLRAAAKTVATVDGGALGKALRAEALVIMDELNLLRQWLTDFKAQVAASSSLADLKTRVAALPNVPQRAKSQILTAIAAKLDSGDSD